MISTQFPFPLSGILYSPAHITEPFKESEFQLTSFVSDDEMVEKIIEQDDSIEEDDLIPTDENIIEEIAGENVVDEIIEEAIEETIVEETIMEVIPVESMTIEETEEEFAEELITDAEIIDSEYSSDKSTILVILLVAVIGVILVYHKKFRNSNKDLKKSFVKNNKSLFNKIIHFDYKITIKIRS